MTTQLVHSSCRQRVYVVASALLLSILPVIAGIAPAQSREVIPVATGHPLLADYVSSTRAKNSVPVRTPNGQPVLVFDATNLDFGTAAVGDSSGWQRTMLTNTGTGDATDLVFTTDPEFPLPPSPNGHPCYGWTVLPAGGTCLVVVKFAPASSGPATGTLSVSSAESAEALLNLTGDGSEESVLYGQFHDWPTQDTFLGLLNSHFVSAPAKDSELADDFEVVASGGWVVSAVGVEILALGRPPTPSGIDIYFMPDSDGVPGDAPACAALDSQITLWEPTDESRVVAELSSPCTLAPGHYWLRSVPTMATPKDALYWGLQFTQPADDPPPMHLDPPVWRNPQGGTGYPGCNEWTPVVPANCSLEEYPYGFYGSVFWIIGQEIVVDPIFADGFEPQ